MLRKFTNLFSFTFFSVWLNTSVISIKKNIFTTLFLKDTVIIHTKHFCSVFTSFMFTIFQASIHYTKTEKFLLLPTL